MKFSIVTIARNESLNLPKLYESAKKYVEAGGKLYLLDTGSTDNTVIISKTLGFEVTESKEKFHKTLNTKTLKEWKRKYGMVKDPVQTPATFFCFDDARNAAAKLADTNIVLFMDGCDHFLTLDFDKINEAIAKEKYWNFSIVQHYSGKRGFVSRFYDKARGSWLGHVHEYVECNGEAWCELPESIISIHHNPAIKERRYMAGLVYTHIRFDESPRWNYYLGRELFFQGFYSDARKLLFRRYENLAFPEERAAAMCFIATSYALEFKDTKDDKVLDEIYNSYKKAYNLNTTLREACFEWCEINRKRGQWREVLESAMKCLSLISNSSTAFFEDERFNQEENLYYYLYLSNWYVGTKDMSVWWWRKFVKAKGIIEERHEHYQFFRDYKYFPSIPYEVNTLNLKNDGFCKTLSIYNTKPTYIYDDFLIDICKRCVPPCTDIIEINAGEGISAVVLSKLIFPGVYYASESSRILYRKMVSNLLLNGCQNVKTYEINIGSNSVFKRDEEGFVDHIDEKQLSIFPIKNTSIFIGTPDEIIDVSQIIVVTPKEKEIPHLNHRKLQLKDRIFYFPTSSTKKIAIACKPWFQWSIYDCDRDKLSVGEAEISITLMARAFALKGYLVDVWCEPLVNDDKSVNPRCLRYNYFLNYLDSSSYYDIVIWWRYIEQYFTKRCKNTKHILYLQDHIYNPIDTSIVDKVLFVSESHKASILEKVTPSVSEISYVLPNLIDEIYFSKSEGRKIKYRCVYLNNHAHGLDTVLSVWLHIKSKFPSATLHIYYNLNTWGINTIDEEKTMDERIKSMRGVGVNLHGTLNTKLLHEELSKAEFWLFPCKYDDPFNSTGLQAILCGVIPIISKQPFLENIAIDKCIFWPLDLFLEKCIEIMSLSQDELSWIREENISKIKNLALTPSNHIELFEKIY